MFIYAGSEQCDSGPIYTITIRNVSDFIQVIEIHPGKNFTGRADP